VDAVWDVATRIDSLGWVAEYRVPLNQLRYPSAPTHVFGFAIWRDVARYNERYSWPLYSRRKGGLSSQLGEISGIDGIASPRRLEVAPYSVAKTTNVPVASGFAQRGEARFGTDVKYGLTSNLTLDGTVNPDFGQVEADPSVSICRHSRRSSGEAAVLPRGSGSLRFDTQCNDGTCSGLFYSRRIGREPQLTGEYDEAGNVTNSTILGAAKLTGRLSNGISVGMLDAVTQAEQSPSGKTIEPRRTISSAACSEISARRQQHRRDAHERKAEPRFVVGRSSAIRRAHRRHRRAARVPAAQLRDSAPITPRATYVAPRRRSLGRS
jgi:hypothetical protein